MHEHSDRVHTLTFLPDNRTLVSGSSDGTLAVWDTMDDRRQVPLNFMLAHGSGVRSLSVSPIDNGIASGGDDSTARLWPTKELLSSRSNPVRWVGHGVILLDLAFTDHGSHICTSDLGGNIILQDVNSQKNVFALKGTDSIVYLDVNEPEALLALLGQTQIRVYSLATREAMWSWNLPYAYTETTMPTEEATISARGVTSWPWDREIRFISLRPVRELCCVASGRFGRTKQHAGLSVTRRAGGIWHWSATRRIPSRPSFVCELVRNTTRKVTGPLPSVFLQMATAWLRQASTARSPFGIAASGNVVGRCVGHTGVIRPSTTRPTDADC